MNEINPAWKTAPYQVTGAVDSRGVELLRKQYPTDKYELKIEGPLEGGLYFFEVTEK